MRLMTFTLTIALGGAPLIAQEKSKTDERLADSATLFSEIMDTPDKSIPQDLLNKSYCIVLVPGLKKGAFVIGGKVGRRFFLCRAQGGWGMGAPARVRHRGGELR